MAVESLVPRSTPCLKAQPLSFGRNSDDGGEARRRRSSASSRIMLGVSRGAV
eukprot:CAMPEP_0184274076 /NCGR_PEP_ID=MMETSP0977-20130417/44726_1 /TAXON_ID=483370 /ORGANISM="non described non described, Strain CCMP2097" /LENGTH=51 /DNA_ID=CAMNT_0026579949 /DNA_START=80 /DNA_END=231 /DNA_ORIENTATION=-